MCVCGFRVVDVGVGVGVGMGMSAGLEVCVSVGVEGWLAGFVDDD